MTIWVGLLVEGELDEQVLSRLIHFTGRAYMIGASFVEGGKSKLKQMVRGYNSAAQSSYCYVLLVDLDRDECPPALINVARRSPPKIRAAIVPDEKSTSKVGKDYNGQLSKFVHAHWNIEAALENSDSLRRAYHCLMNFEPEREET